MDITNGIQSVSATGALASVDASAVSSADWTLHLAIHSLDGGAARIAIEESTTDDFATALPLALVDVQGPVTTVRGYTFRAYALPSAQIGHQNAKLRANVVRLTGTSLTFAAEVQ
jgi:hypothetical protein